MVKLRYRNAYCKLDGTWIVCCWFQYPCSPNMCVRASIAICASHSPNFRLWLFEKPPKSILKNYKHSHMKFARTVILPVEKCFLLEIDHHMNFSQQRALSRVLVSYLLQFMDLKHYWEMISLIIPLVVTGSSPNNSGLLCAPASLPVLVSQSPATFFAIHFP